MVAEDEGTAPVSALRGVEAADLSAAARCVGGVAIAGFGCVLAVAEEAKRAAVAVLECREMHECVLSLLENSSGAVSPFLFSGRSLPEGPGPEGAR